MAKNDKCDCGHSRQEHALVQKEMSTLDVLLSPTRIVTMKEDRGECTICHCPKYELPKRMVPRWGMDYSPRIIKNDDDLEKRCARCGTLLSNHDAAYLNHPFQSKNKTPI
ncbi:hypothetical protein [Nitrosopumilus sp.]|uniref:hypothetical protein n=1 Tax=Nitrosopumilus sp. TaxID=2024843 RepID=UPI00292F6AA0|nr:hypothetical protein [Nitrosopumilus sp.]